MRQLWVVRRRHVLGLAALLVAIAMSATWVASSRAALTSDGTDALPTIAGHLLRGSTINTPATPGDAGDVADLWAAEHVTMPSGVSAADVFTQLDAWRADNTWNSYQGPPFGLNLRIPINHFGNVVLGTSPFTAVWSVPGTPLSGETARDVVFREDIPGRPDNPSDHRAWAADTIISPVKKNRCVRKTLEETPGYGGYPQPPADVPSYYWESGCYPPFGAGFRAPFDGWVAMRRIASDPHDAEHPYQWRSEGVVGLEPADCDAGSGWSVAPGYNGELSRSMPEPPDGDGWQLMVDPFAYPVEECVKSGQPSQYADAQLGVWFRPSHLRPSDPDSGDVPTQPSPSYSGFQTITSLQQPVGEIEKLLWNGLCWTPSAALVGFYEGVLNKDICGPLDTPPPASPTALEFMGGGNAAIPNQQRCKAADPVDCGTGNFYESQTDIAIGGRGLGLALTRTYNAQIAANAPGAGRFGYGWGSSYVDRIDVDGDAGIATVVQSNGSRVPFAIRADGAFEAPDRVQATLSQATNGQFSYVLPDRSSMEFDRAGRLLSQSDRNGNTTIMAYDGSGRLDEVIDPVGRTLEFSYNGDGTVSSVEDSDDREVSYEYDDGDLVGVTDVRGEEWAFVYDSEHRMTSMTNPRGKTTTNVYDSVDRVTSQTNPLSQTTSFAYDEDVDGGDNTETTITKPGGAVTREVFVGFQPTKVVKASGTPDASSTDLAYDEDGNLSSVTDGNGNETTFTYDSAGNRTSATNERDETTSWTYNSHRDVTSVTDPLDHVTTLTYDTKGNLTKVERELEETDDVAETTMVYNGFGELTSSTDALDRETTFEYDADGNLVKTTTPEGHESTATYDDVSQIESVTTPRGNADGATPADFTTTYVRNAAGLPTTITDPLDHDTVYVYDEMGNVTSVTDRDGRETQFVYDDLGRQTTVIRPDETELVTAYDMAGNVTSRTDGRGKLTDYDHDLLHRVTSVTDPLNRETTFGYDDAGNRTSLTDAKGHTTTYGYDGANRLASVDYDTSTADIDYDYDDAGRRTQMIDGTGTTTYSYDTLDRLTSTTSGAGQTVGYTYDLAGQVTAIDYPDALTAVKVGSHDTPDHVTTGMVERDYDLDGNLTSVTDWLENTTEFSYDPDGNLTSTERPNGKDTTATFDRNDQLASLTDRGANTSYTRTAQGLLSQAPVGGLANQALTRDDIARLTGVGSVDYAYDDSDNLTQTLNADRVATAQAFDDANQLTEADPATGSTTTFDYDANGNRTTATTAGDPAASFSWDQANQLIGYQSAPAQPTIASAGGHALGLQPDGTVKAWGKNDHGQLGDGTTTATSTPQTVAGLDDIRQVAAGEGFSLALKADGGILAWGSNASGQLGDGGQPLSMPLLDDFNRADGSLNTGNWSALSSPAAEISSNRAASASGTRGSYWNASTFGSDSEVHATVAAAGGAFALYARLGFSGGMNGYEAGYSGSAFYLWKIVGGTWTQIGSPQTHSVTAGDDVSFRVIGSQLSILVNGDEVHSGTDSAITGPGRIGFEVDATVELDDFGGGNIPSPFPSTTVIDDANRSDSSTLGTGWDAYSWTPKRARIASNQIAASADGADTWQFRSTSYGPDSEVHAKFAVMPSGSSAVQLYLRWNPSTVNGYAITALADEVLVERVNSWTPTTIKTIDYDLDDGDSLGARMVGDDLTVYAKPSGGDWEPIGDVKDTTHMGAGKIGFYIDSTTTRIDDFGGGGATTTTIAPPDVKEPQQVAGIDDVIQVAAGDALALALDRDGHVWSWGANQDGQLGNGTTTPRATPTLIEGLEDVVAIAAGGSHAMAMTADGHVYTWGNNAADQLGPDRDTDHDTPELVDAITDATAIAAGDDFSLVIDDDEAVAFGVNDHHQLGDASTPGTPGTPVVAYDDEPITTIAAHGQTALAMTADGDVIAWGANNHGQLADGTTTDRTPDHIPTLAGYGAIAVGDGAGFAISPGGTAKAWGDGAHGQLGIGNTTNQTSPTMVTSYAPDPAHTTTASYSYNGDGTRVTRTVDGLRTHQAWDVSTGLPTVITDGPTAYITGPGGLPIEQVTSNGLVRYYHHDQQGSTVALTDQAGDAVATYTHDAYGNLASSTGTAVNPFRYNGQYTDDETGLQYLRARHYDPATGQFLSRDPIEDITGQAYAYAAGSPFDYVDLGGLRPEAPGWMKAAGGWVADRGMDLSNASASALDGLSGGLSTKAAGGIFGFDPDCADFGATSGVIKLTASLLPVGRVGKAASLGVRGLGSAALSQSAKRGLAKQYGRIPRGATPIAQGGSSAAGRWWEYLDSDGVRKIVVEHADGTVHVGIPKRQSTHLSGGPPRYYDYGGFGHVGE